jgi:hypothetical protein
MTADQRIFAIVVRRICKSGLLGPVTLRIPKWRATLHGCRWVEEDGRERVLLPQRQWIDKQGAEHSAEILVFDNTDLLRRFETEALEPINRLARRGDGGSR